MIVGARVVRYELPFLAPVVAGDGIHESRSGLLLGLEDDAGAVGWGEAAPLPGWSAETLPQVEVALHGLADSLAERPRRPGSLGPTVMAWTARIPAAAAALDLAILDLVALRSGQSIASFLASPLQPAATVPVNALIAGNTPDEVSLAASAAAAQGFTVFKMKLGDRVVADDVARVGALRESVGPEASIRLDAGGVWDMATAIDALERLALFTIEYVEDPVADLELLIQMAPAVDVPIAVDGLLARAEDPLAVVDAAVADVFVLKPSAMGGLRFAAGVAAAVADRGGDVVVTSFLDSSIGLTGAVHLAAALPRASTSGLATSYLFSENVAEPPTVRDGAIEVPTGPGLGVAPVPQE